MGRDKALLQHGEQSQLSFVVGVLEEYVQRVFVSAREEQKNDRERSQYDQIIDRYDELGPIAGILSALEEYPSVDWLVVACDLPNIDAITIRHMLQKRSVDYPFTAYVSSHDGLPEPLCAIYGSGCADIVREFVRDGMNCPRKILIRSNTQLLQQPNPSSLDNINTPEDLDESVLQVAQ
jgi:molybdopterin-guanine dinucleotide biosynthesis protein A